jgi:hypothetical protein
MSQALSHTRCPRARRRLFRAVAIAATLAPRGGAFAQTWLNPVSGSWSIGANWVGGVAPVLSSSTQLAFGATGVQSYSAFNDIANPFTLNALRFDTSSIAPISIAGGALTFAGTAPTITHVGSGEAVIANALTFPSAGTADLFPVTADHLRFNGPLFSSGPPTAMTGAYAGITGNATLSGGANLLSITIRFGDLTVTGGESRQCRPLRRAAGGLGGRVGDHHRQQRRHACVHWEQSPRHRKR